MVREMIVIENEGESGVAWCRRELDEAKRCTYL
jgi:hypothetical protein